MAGGNQRRPLKALFVGNSFTARNDLPGLVAQLAAARGRRLEHRLISAGGASLRTHWNAGVALEVIQGGQYDHVILQEQSTDACVGIGRELAATVVPVGLAWQRF